MSRITRLITADDRAEAERIVSAVAADHCISVDELRARCRRDYIVRARAEAVYRVWMATDMTLMNIAALVGVKDHSSVIYLRDLHARRYVA